MPMAYEAHEEAETRPRRPVNVAASVRTKRSARAARTATIYVAEITPLSTLTATKERVVAKLPAAARTQKPTHGAPSNSGLRPIVSLRRPSCGEIKMSRNAAHEPS